MYVCMYLWKNVCVYVCMYVCMYVWNCDGGQPHTNWQVFTMCQKALSQLRTPAEDVHYENTKVHHANTHRLVSKTHTLRDWLYADFQRKPTTSDMLVFLNDRQSIEHAARTEKLKGVRWNAWQTWNKFSQRRTSALNAHGEVQSTLLYFCQHHEN